MEAALAEALRLGHNHIGTEHLLLGLWGQPDSGAVGVLAGLGVAKAPVEAWIAAELARSTGRSPA